MATIHKVDIAGQAGGWFDETSTASGWFYRELEDTASAPAGDDSIPRQMTATQDFTHYDPEVEEGTDFSGTTAGPKEDAAVVVDTNIAVKHFDLSIFDEDADSWTPDWAQAPPKDLNENCLYPVVLSVTAGSNLVTGTSHVVTLPTLSVGDLALVIFGDNGNTHTATAGWTENVDNESFVVYSRVITGTEGSSMTITSSATTESVWYVVRIQAGTYNVLSAISTSVTLNGTRTPPLLNFGWDDKTLVFAGVAGDTASSPITFGYPTNMPTDQYGQETGGVDIPDAYITFATARVNGSTFSPGLFTLTNQGASNHDTATFAVRGSCPEPDILGKSLLDWIDEDEPLTEGSFSSPPDGVVATDDTIAGKEFSFLEDDEEPLTQGVFAGPAEESNEDTKFFLGSLNQPEEDEELTEGFTARGLSFPEDETGQTTGRVSNNDWTDEDEPVTDGFFAGPAEEDQEQTRFTRPSNNDWVDEDEPVTEGFTACGTGMPQDETGETIAGSSNLGWVDEDEPETLGHFGSPLEDIPEVVVADVPLPLLGEVFDEDEPLTEGFFSGPIEETHEDTQILGKSNLDWIDEDEPETLGWFGTSLEDAPAPNTDRAGSSFPDDADLEGEEFSPEFFSGTFGSPLEDTPEVPVVPPSGGYPWYYGEGKRKKRRLIFPYVEEPSEVPQTVRKAAKKAEQAALILDLKKEVQAAPLVLPGNAGLLLEASDSSIRRLVAEAAARDRKIQEEARLQAELRRVQQDLAKAEALLYDFFLEETYKESAMLLTQREARRRELEKEEEQLLIQLAAEYF